MEKLMAAASKETLANTVKLIQKQGMKGARGDWKEFLDFYDNKFGSNLSDPAKRSSNILTAFLKTFTKEKDLELIIKIMKCHVNIEKVEQFTKSSSDSESPQQRLVRLTIENPLYRKYYHPLVVCNEEWVVTKFRKLSKAMKSNSMIAVDCEMVLCEDGTEAVVKICLIDHNLEVKLEKLVNPQKDVADYRTEITGVSAKDLKGVTCSLVDVQKSMKRLLSDGTILVGHTLYNDLQALKLSHPRVIDTALIFEYLDDPTNSTPSLNNLCKAVLGHEVRRDGAPHNCQDDACAAMKLVLAKIEHGFNDPIAIAKNDTPETKLRKLLIHRIPIGVLSQELTKIFPADFTVEIEPNGRVRGEKYSTYAVFDDSEAAEEAFEKIDGKVEKDLHGLPQKLISFQSANGLVASFYIRKMTINTILEQGTLSKKRSVDDEVVQSKKLKAGIHQQDHIEDDAHGHAKETLCHHGQEHPCKHVKEIEKLKRQLQEREEELFNLQKLLSALTRKHGL